MILMVKKELHLTLCSIFQREIIKLVHYIQHCQNLEKIRLQIELKKKEFMHLEVKNKITSHLEL